MFKQSKSLTLLLVALLLILSACQKTPSPPESETSLPSGWHEAEVLLPGFDKPQKVAYEIVGNEAIFEGDIILGEVDAQGNLIQGDLASQGIVKDSGRWPGGIIPFVIDRPNLTARGIANIESAIRHWEKHTPINFVETTRQAQSSYVEFIRGTDPDACYSAIGRTGTRQTIKLRSNGDCGAGTLIHEIGHAVGLYHEQSREDRESHITMLWDNVQTSPIDRRPSYRKVTSGASDVGNYDFRSIMHYSCTTFGKVVNGVKQNTFTPLDPPSGVSCTASGMNRIGQREGLSQGDIYTVLTIYPIVTHPRLLGDVNKDGRRDIVAFWNDGVYVSLSNGSGFAPMSRWTEGFSHNNGIWRSDKHLRLLADVNNDGRQDIVGFGDEGVYVSLSTGFSFGQATFVVNEFGYEQGWRLDMHPRFLADVNADGKQDIVGFANNGVYVSLSTSTATVPSFTPATEPWLEGLGFNDFYRVEKHPRFLADINADGKQDIVAFGDAGVWTALSTGTGFTPAAFVLAEFGYGPTGGNWRIEKNPRLLGDVNGDRKPDIVGFANDGGAYVSLSTGDGGFSAISNWSPEGFLGWQVDKHPRLITNIDGNLQRDILGFGDAGVWVSLSTGSGFAQNTFWLADFGYNEGWRIDKNPRFLADVNGDRRPDIVGFGDDGVWTALSTGTNSFSRAGFVLAQYGYNDGWR